MSQSKLAYGVFKQNDMWRNRCTNVIGNKERLQRTFSSINKFENQCMHVHVCLKHIRDAFLLETRAQDPYDGKDIYLHVYVKNRQSHKPEYIDPWFLSNHLSRQGHHEIILTSTNRVHTYNNWKYNKQYPKYLAEAGFYYRGDEAFVHCFKCGIKTDVKQWFPGENPRQAHARIKPDCQYVIDNDFKPRVNDLVKNGLIGTVHDKETVYTETFENQKLEIDGSLNQSDSVIPECHQSVQTAEHVSNDAMNTQLVQATGVTFKYLEFSDMKSRIQTFNTWNFESKQKATDLAKAGYFYTGEKDIVRCFCCDLGLAEWDPRDDAWIEHARHSPSCWFLLHEKGNVFVQDIQKKWKQIYNPKHAEYDSKESRQSTFNGWREDISQTPEMLADAGFFFTGEEDVVRCHYCDGGLRNWEPDDDPWEEHTRWFPFCKFVIKMKGREYIETIRQQTRQEPTEENAGNNITEDEMTSQQVIDQLRQLQISNEDINSAINRFKNQKEVKAMTVQWMMEVIYGNNSPFAVGNEKKEEPVEKDPKKLLETNRILKEKFFCMRCKTNEACILFVNCGHRVTCEICAEKMDFCIHCNTKVTKRIKTFLS